MKKWTIEAMAGNVNCLATCEVTEPEGYVSFPTKTMAECFALSLSSNEDLAINFIETMWGDSYSECSKFHFKAVEKDWWPDEATKSSISKLENTVSSRIRTKFSREVNSILKSAITEIRALNTTCAFGFQQPIDSLEYRIVGQYAESAFTIFMKALDKNEYFKAAAADQINSKLDMLNFDD